MMNNLILALVFVAMVIGPVFLTMRLHADKDIEPPLGDPRS